MNSYDLIQNLKTHIYNLSTHLVDLKPLRVKIIYVNTNNHQYNNSHFMQKNHNKFLSSCT